MRFLTGKCGTIIPHTLFAWDQILLHFAIDGSMFVFFFKAANWPCAVIAMRHFFFSYIPQRMIAVCNPFVFICVAGAQGSVHKASLGLLDPMLLAQEQQGGRAGGDGVCLTCT